MSKRIVFLGSRNAGEKNDVRALQALAVKKFGSEAEWTVMFWEDLYFVIEPQHQAIIDTQSDTDLADYDCFITMNWYHGGKLSMYRDAAFTVALYLQSRSIPFWNNEMAHQRSASKLSAMMQLALLGCDIPASYYSLSGDVVAKAVPVAFPCVVKAAKASRGRSNFLVDDKDALDTKLAAASQPNKYLVQEYIPNNGDIRVVCANNEPVLAIKRQRTDSSTHLNNVSQGATATKLSLKELPADILQLCRAVSRSMGRDIAGIDLMQASNTSRTVFLEVNAIPQLTSGSYVDEKVNAVLSAILEFPERKDV